MSSVRHTLLTRAMQRQTAYKLFLSFPKIALNLGWETIEENGIIS